MLKSDTFAKKIEKQYLKDKKVINLKIVVIILGNKEVQRTAYVI